jgi:hypothetical protein
MDAGVVFGIVVIAVVTSVIAQIRGRSGIGWFLLGLIGPIIALFAVVLMPKVTAGPTPETHVKCPDCKELILREAKVCKHCGCKLVAST